MDVSKTQHNLMERYFKYLTNEGESYENEKILEDG